MCVPKKLTQLISHLKMQHSIRAGRQRPQSLFLQSTNHPTRLFRFSLVLCLTLFLANRTTSTYTRTFIDHKTQLLNTPKQLITNTLKQIKPKFNPRSSFTSNDKQQKLNVYDLSGDVKTVRKQSPKEQLPQGTYYYTDYKPLVKHLIPMSPLCPETGRTVCKDIKTYPIDSILNLILEAKANKFNFSSLFVDESQNADTPNFNDPELDSAVAKCGGGSDEKTPDYDKDEKSYQTTTNAPAVKGYDGVKTARDYKRPGSSTVYYDNNENYSNGQEPPNPSNFNAGYENNNYDQNSYDKGYDKGYEQQQRINENANSYDQHPKAYPSSSKGPNLVGGAKPYHEDQEQKQPTNPPPPPPPAEQYNDHQQPIEQYKQYKEPVQQKATYQQPQSSIKFEQQYQRQEKHNSRPPPPPASYRSVPVQDLNYRTSNQNNYYQTRKTPISRPGSRPFRTTVTIIPFIQYITQLPTNEYQISNSDKHLLETISQSLRNAPTLNGLTPDAWLPIRAYTMDEVQPTKEMAEHLATHRLSNDELANDHLSGDGFSGEPVDELRSDYTTNYRGKRSPCTQTEDVGEASKRKTAKDQPAKSQAPDRKADESSSITRVKKQAGFDEEPEELCQTKRLYITPKAALNDKSEWRYIVNVGERDARLKQVIKVDVCASPNGPCSSQISLPFGYVSKCKQKYIKKKLLAIDPDGQSTSTENFFIPSCCVCEINRVNP